MGARSESTARREWMKLFDELTYAEIVIGIQRVRFDKSLRTTKAGMVRKSEEPLRQFQLFGTAAQPHMLGDQRNPRRSDPRVGRRKSDWVR